MTAFRGRWQTLDGSAADSCGDRGGVTAFWAGGEVAVCRAGPSRGDDGIPGADSGQGRGGGIPGKMRERYAGRDKGAATKQRAMPTARQMSDRTRSRGATEAAV